MNIDNKNKNKFNINNYYYASSYFKNFFFKKKKKLYLYLKVT